MPRPAWIGDGFAAVLVVVGLYCLARLGAVAPLGRRTHVDANLGHVLMAVAMVGMLVPGWHTLPSEVWLAVFLVLALWFLGRTVQVLARDGLSQVAGERGVHLRHYAVHGVMALSMVYMEALGTGSTGSTGGAGTAMGMGAAVGVPVLTLVFMVVLLASAVWQIDGVGRLMPSPQPAVAAPATPSPGLSGATSAIAVVPRAAAAGADGGGAARPWLAPRLEVACHVAMCLAMAYMLVLVV